VAASAIDTLLLDGVAVNQFAGSSVLEVADSSYGMSDNVRIVTPAACVGVIYGGEHRVYADTGFVAMRDETFNPSTLFADIRIGTMGCPTDGGGFSVI
jgi:serine/threonine-protein kinase